MTERDERLAVILDRLEGLLEDARLLVARRQPPVLTAAPEECGTRRGYLPEIIEGTAPICRLPMGHPGSHQFSENTNPCAEVPPEPLGPGEHRPDDPTLTYIAERQTSMAHVLATPFEMLRAMEGNPIVVLDSNGNEVLLRIPTEDEAIAAYHAACGKLDLPIRPEGEAHARQSCKPVSLA